MDGETSSPFGELITFVGNNLTWSAPTQERLNEHEKRQTTPVDEVEITLEAIAEASQAVIRPMTLEEIKEYIKRLRSGPRHRSMNPSRFTDIRENRSRTHDRDG